MIDDAVAYEVLRQLLDSCLRGLLQHGDGLHQHVGVILLALGKERLQQRDTDGTTEVAHHVEQARGRARILRLDAGGSDS